MCESLSAEISSSSPQPLLVLCHISVELIEEDLENAASIEAAWVSETTLLAGWGGGRRCLPWKMPLLSDKWSGLGFLDINCSVLLGLWSRRGGGLGRLGSCSALRGGVWQIVLILIQTGRGGSLWQPWRPTVEEGPKDPLLSLIILLSYSSFCLSSYPTPSSCMSCNTLANNPFLVKCNSPTYLCRSLLFQNIYYSKSLKHNDNFFVMWHSVAIKTEFIGHFLTC